MKKNMKKIIFVLSFATLFIGSSAFAATWNSASNDCPTVTVSNISTGSGTNPNVNGCEPYTSIQAGQGDEIGVSIYYHNTSSSPATNVRVSLSKNPSSGSANTHSFSAAINSDQGSASGSGQVNISSSQTLDFSRAVWQPNQGRSSVSFPNGQNGSQVINGGVNIGTINSGWNTQGYVIVYFRTSSTVINPPQNNNNYYCNIDSFRASSKSIDKGDRVTFYWDTTDCTYVTLTSISGSLNPDDSKNTYPDYSRNYCLSAYGNNGGRDEECIYIDVDDRIVDNNQNLEVETNNATNVNTTYATINGYLDPDGSYATRWFKYGTSSSYLNKTTSRVNQGYGASNFSAYLSNLSPNTTYYFQAVGENSDGDIEYGRVLNFNTNANVVINNLSAVTTLATGVTTNSAVLNGLVLNTESIQTNAHFEYGTTTGLGNSTVVKNIGSGSAINAFEILSGLSSNTIYYYRIVGQNGNGIAYGEIKFFRTLSAGVTPPVNPGTPKTTLEALASIDISNKYELVRENDIIDYTITYKNTGKTKLRNSVLQVFVPEHVNYTNSSRGNYNPNSRELVVYLEDLNPNDSGVVYMQGQVFNLPSNVSQIVTTAMLVYTNEKNAQENVMDTVLNRVVVNTVNPNLASAAFFAWLGSLSLCFWLFLIILILLAILFSRLYRRSSVVNKHYNAPVTNRNNYEKYNGGHYDDGDPYSNLPK